MPTTKKTGPAPVLPLLFALMWAGTASAQVVNGSFEDGSQPSLDGWRFTCNAGQSWQAAPPGGGEWSLKLALGNLQGCFPGLGFQTIPNVQDGDVWTLSAWTRRDAQILTTGSIYFRVVDVSGSARMLSADSTTSTEWTQLSVTDTLRLAADDTVHVVLDAGLTSGPTMLDVGFEFDLVEIVRIGPVGVGEDGPGGSASLSPNFPNPFSEATTIPFQLQEAESVRLEVYDALGRRMETLVTGRLPVGSHAAVWSPKDAPAGTYFARLETDSGIRILRMILTR